MANVKYFLTAYEMALMGHTLSEHAVYARLVEYQDVIYIWSQQRIGWVLVIGGR